MSKIAVVYKSKYGKTKRYAECESDDVGILETYGKDVDFSDKATIEPLMEYARTL